MHLAGHHVARVPPVLLCAFVVFLGTWVLFQVQKWRALRAESVLVCRYGLYALHFILAVNGTPTPTLDAFVEAVSKLEDRSWVRLKLVSACAAARLELRFCPLSAGCKRL